MDKGEAIRRNWERAGSPLCAHEERAKERYLGADTGDWLCLGCGTTWPRNSPTPAPEGVASLTEETR